MRLALGTLLVLLFFAWHFYLERAAYYDLAWHTYVYTKTQALFLQNRRFVAVVTQWPTLMAVKAGLPLDVVLRLYSLVFVGYYLAVFLACAYWLRNEQVALVVPLLMVLLSTRTFYWSQSELPQALMPLLLFYAGVARQAPIQRRFSSLALAALIPVFIFGYPTALIAFLFVWVYDWLLNRRFRDWAYYGYLALALALHVLRTKLIPPGSYEDSQMTFVPNLLKYFPNYLSLESFDNFWHLSTHNFILLPLLLAVLTVFYLRQRSWLATLRLLLIWGSVVGYVFIVSVTRGGYTEVTYLENLYLPLTFFVAIPLAMELLPALERRWQGQGRLVAAALLAVVLGLRLAVLWHQHIPYTAYQQWLKHLLTYTRQFPERKYIMYPDNVDPQGLRAGWPWWAMASETMMVSARQNPDSVQTVRVGWDVDQLAAAGAQTTTFLEPFDNIPSAQVPTRYYRFPNTAYRVLNTQPPQDTAALRRYIGAHRQVQLQLVDSLPTAIRAGQVQQLRVQVRVPAAAQPLHSGIRGPYPTLIRSGFYKPHNWPSDTAPLEVALEVDVWQPWTQTIRVQAPHQPGRYTLEISLVSKDFQDWPVRLRRPVDVTE
jgi:hypothetical protein